MYWTHLETVRVENWWNGDGVGVNIPWWLVSIWQRLSCWACCKSRLDNLSTCYPSLSLSSSSVFHDSLWAPDSCFLSRFVTYLHEFVWNLLLISFQLKPYWSMCLDRIWSSCCYLLVALLNIQLSIYRIFQSEGGAFRLLLVTTIGLIRGSSQEKVKASYHLKRKAAVSMWLFRPVAMNLGCACMRLSSEIQTACYRGMMGKGITYLCGRDRSAFQLQLDCCILKIGTVSGWPSTIEHPLSRLAGENHTKMLLPSTGIRLFFQVFNTSHSHHSAPPWLARMWWSQIWNTQLSHLCWVHTGYRRRFTILDHLVIWAINGHWQNFMELILGHTIGCFHQQGAESSRLLLKAVAEKFMWPFQLPRALWTPCTKLSLEDTLDPALCCENNHKDLYCAMLKPSI